MSFLKRKPSKYILRFPKEVIEESKKPFYKFPFFSYEPKIKEFRREVKKLYYYIISDIKSTKSFKFLEKLGKEEETPVLIDNKKKLTKKGSVQVISVYTFEYGSSKLKRTDFTTVSRLWQLGLKESACRVGYNKKLLNIVFFHPDFISNKSFQYPHARLYSQRHKTCKFFRNGWSVLCTDRRCDFDTNIWWVGCRPSLFRTSLFLKKYRKSYLKYCRISFVVVGPLKLSKKNKPEKIWIPKSISPRKNSSTYDFIFKKTKEVLMELYYDKKKANKKIGNLTIKYISLKFRIKKFIDDYKFSFVFIMISFCFFFVFCNLILFLC